MKETVEMQKLLEDVMRSYPNINSLAYTQRNAIVFLVYKNTHKSFPFM